MKRLHLLLVLLISSVAFSQKIVTKSYNSKELGAQRNLKIYIPKKYDENEKLKYPIAIVLGDQYLFDLYVGNAKLFADTDKAPQQIVIGIDMEKTYSKDVSIIPSNDALTSVGKKFYNFIKKEIIPYAEATYRTSPFMAIAGEGKAANFITHFLKEEKPIFNSYVLASPQFSDLALNTIESYSLSRLGNIDNTFFIYASNNKEFIPKEQNDKFKQIGTYLSSFETKNLHIKFDEFNTAPNLLSVISETLPRAFTKMFALYAKITKYEFEANVKDLEPLEAIKYLEQKYLDIEYLYGNNLNVRLDDIFTIEGIVIDKQNGDYLRVLGDFVMIKYPELHLGDYYVGKYYEIGKDYEKADFYYKAAYGKMDPSDPYANAFYENIKRVNDLMKKQKPAEEENLDPEEDNNNEDDDN
ncbi:alpha/beta hydrolase-fold protein [Tenacibaculum holothuriorum]|uniref:alpha/beta hydrolase-fold protein n=1 Tax=Tenacibaculum holothuriorum TaxID=1635173 RepID=UPI000A3273AA|nr:alpha/beta hydrolase-fold protein [Tenacibaculum holothuriorum]